MKSPNTKNKKYIPNEIKLALNNTFAKLFLESSLLTGSKYKNNANGLSITKNAIINVIINAKSFKRSYLRLIMI